MVKSSLRVALFTDADVFAGTERHIFDLARGLRSEGVEVCIACPSPSVLEDRAAEAALSFIPIQKQGLVDRAAVRALTDLLKSDRIDIVHAHNGRTMLSAALAVKRAGRGKAIATQHFLEPDHVSRRGPKAVLYQVAHHWVSGKTAQFVAISEAVRKGMIDRNDAPERKVTVVPNGMAPPDRNALTPPETVRAALGVSPEAPLVVCAARLEREKDIGSLIAAMAEVKTTCPTVACVVAGAGSLQETLQQQIVQSGLQNTVRLLGFRDDVLALILAGDLFVLPSLAEPFGLVLLEAMALGKPVVATRAGGPLEIVVDNDTGLLTPPSDPRALAGAIQRLVMDRPTRLRMGERGYARFQERFTAERMSQAMLKVYERALQTKT